MDGNTSIDIGGWPPTDAHPWATIHGCPSADDDPWMVFRGWHPRQACGWPSSDGRPSMAIHGWPFTGGVPLMVIDGNQLIAVHGRPGHARMAIRRWPSMVGKLRIATHGWPDADGHQNVVQIPPPQGLRAIHGQQLRWNVLDRFGIELLGG